MVDYNNKEYIDWVTLGNFLTETVLETTYRVTAPKKMQIRDMAIFLNALNLDGGNVTVQISPDNMETPVESLVPANMKWYDHPSGVFAATVWENIDASEGWMRFKIEGYVAEGNVDIAISTRPRVEKVI